MRAISLRHLVVAAPISAGYGAYWERANNCLWPHTDNKGIPLGIAARNLLIGETILDDGTPHDPEHYKSTLDQTPAILVRSGDGGYFVGKECGPIGATHEPS